MMQMLKTVLGIIPPAALVSALALYPLADKYARSDAPLAAYVSEQLPVVMKSHSRRLNTQTPPVPRIEYDHASSPALSVKQNEYSSKSVNGGRYDAPLKTVHLNADLLISPRARTQRMIRRILGYPFRMVDQTLQHEVAHHIAYEINDKNELMLPGTHMNNNPGKKDLGSAFPIEATATYFDGRTPDCSTISWPVSVRVEEYEGIDRMYDIAYCLGKPIIDEFGVRGINYLLRTPVEFGVGSFEEYQHRALIWLRTKNQAGQTGPSSE